MDRLRNRSANPRPDRWHAIQTVAELLEVLADASPRASASSLLDRPNERIEVRATPLDSENPPFFNRSDIHRALRGGYAREEDLLCVDPPRSWSVPIRLSVSARRFTIGRVARRLRAWEGRLGARLRAWEARRFDEEFGIDTGGQAEPSELTLADGVASDGFTYVGTPPRLARLWLDALPPNLGGYTFVDMGSGKARVLLLAARREFRRIVGVEFAVELHEAAVANVARFRPPAGRGDIEPVLGDAASFEFPLEPLVVHFNNPFSERVMSSVVANLSASYQQHPRPMVVVYQQLQVEQPEHRTRNVDLLRALSFLAHRSVRPRTPLDRMALRPFAVDLFESREVVRGD